MSRIDQCLNCGSEIIHPHLQRVRKFCNLKCDSEYAQKRRFAERLIPCKLCGKSFDPIRKDRERLYCSRECAVIAHTKHNNIFTCQHCGKVFSNTHDASRGRKYCSLECFNSLAKKQAARASKQVICAYCKEQFTAQPASKKKYCSKECRLKAGWIPSDPTKKSIFTCQWCNKDFEEWTYRKPDFCSNQCRSEYGARQPKPSARRPENILSLFCHWCGKTYKIHKSVIETSKRASRFCSAECKHSAMSLEKKGAGNPNYVDGSSPQNYGEDWYRQSRKARKRDGNTCQDCGLKGNWKAGDIVDVHHKIPLRLFDGDYKTANQLSNLVCLCRKCHRKAEILFRRNHSSVTFSSVSS